jgi:hypothetical protein
MARPIVAFFMGVLFGIFLTIGSAYAWFEWFGGKEYIKHRITQEVSKTVTGKIKKSISPFSWFGGK